MPNFNRVILMGNLTRDVELKSTPSNQSVAKLGLAVNRRWKTPEGEMREEVTFVDCEAWGRTAENIAKYFSKGKPIHLEGRLRLDQWEKEGVKHSKLKVVVDNFEFVETRGGGGGGGGGGSPSSGEGEDYSQGSARPARPASAARPSGPNTGHTPVGEDDIPF